MPGSPARPVVAPLFGAYLFSLRAGRSRGVICRRVSAIAGYHFDPSTLLQYERGTVAAPDPLMLDILARLYRVELSALLDVLRGDRVGRPVTPEVTDPRRTRVLHYIDACGARELDALCGLLDLLFEPPLVSSSTSSSIVVSKAASRGTNATGRQL